MNDSHNTLPQYNVLRGERVGNGSPLSVRAIEPKMAVDYCEGRDMAAIIYVVSADNHVRTALRSWLEVEFPYYHVTELISVEGALARTFYEVPNLIIIDMDSSEQSGIAAIGQLKTFRPEVPLVILTFLDEDAHRAEAMQAGAVAIISTRKMQDELTPQLSKFISRAIEYIKGGHDGFRGITPPLSVLCRF